MRKWIVKALVQKAISLLPHRHRINYFFQKYVTRGVRLSPGYFEDRLRHFRRHQQFYRKYKGDSKGARVLELGTGWYPVVPLGFFLTGARSIDTVDITRLMDREKLRTTLRMYRNYAESGRLSPFLVPDLARYAVLNELLKSWDRLSLPEILDRLRLSYLTVDARKLPVPDDTFDLIISNNTFEHIYPDVLRDILSEFMRVLKPGGLMSHFIDLSDHFAHLDPSITIYNFLRFSPRAWLLIDNEIQPQNRWRLYQYRELYRALRIPITEEANRPGDLDALRSVPLDEQYLGVEEAELAISHSYLVSHC